MLTGIDQGEVMSPLLWCIYYDPLLCEINKQELGYNLVHNHRPNLYDAHCEFKSECVGSLAFMDDTTWIAETKDSLESMLAIADDFYALTSIKVNKEKSELLVHVPGQPTPDVIHLKFGSTTVDIRPAEYSESVRILGVWMNLKGQRQFIVQQAKDEVATMCRILQRKRLTDKQLLYLWNMVIIPRIEYRTQLTFLSSSECSTIAAPFRRLFKYKLNFSSTAPNALLANRLIYHFRDLYEVQLQSKISNFLVQLNDSGLLGSINNIRLLQLQFQEWLPTSPLISWPYDKINKRFSSRFFAFMLTLCRQQQISFDVAPLRSSSIVGGTTYIRDIITLSPSDLKSLRNQSILYMEQLTSLDGRSLLTWNLIMRKSFIVSRSFRSPIWFRRLEAAVLPFADSRLLHADFCTTVATSMKGTVLSPSLPSVTRSRDWVAIWNPILQSVSLGRSISPSHSPDTILIEHWFISASTASSFTLSRCSGCSIHNPDYAVNNSRLFSCINIFTLSDSILISSIPSDVKKLSSSSFLFSLPLFDILQKADFHMKFSYNLLPYYEPLVPSMRLSDNFLTRFISKGRSLQELSTIQSRFSSSSRLEFYTDGSLIRQNSLDSNLSCAFIQTYGFAVPTTFCAQLENFPSSTKAETVAILLSLLVAPASCAVSIFTDSQAAIDIFGHVTSTNLTSRLLLKHHQSFIWNMIRDVVTTNHLDVSLVKVKAHSKHYFNDQVDALARSVHDDSNSVLLTFNSSSVSMLGILPQWNGLTIEKPFRHFFSHLSTFRGFQLWLSLARNSKYLHLDVDWASTFFYLSDDETISDTSFSASFRKAHRLKFLIEELPTFVQLSKCRPDIYSSWYCLDCNVHRESFNHVWLCPSRRSLLDSFIISLKTFLVDQVVTSAASPALANSFNLQVDSIWDLSFDSSSLTFLDLIKGVVPLALASELQRVIKDSSVTRQLLSVFMDQIYSFALDAVWKPRCVLVLAKEASLGISRRDKKLRVSNPSSNIASVTRSRVSSSFVDYSDFEFECRKGVNFLSSFRCVVNHLPLVRLVRFIFSLF
jgi:ribonuclease HI